MVPEELRYTDQHEWARLEGSVVAVGITDYAQQQLGDLTYVEYPGLGKDVSSGEEVCVVESTKAASSVYAVADGKVLAVNEALEDEPAPVNADPYGEGWMYQLELADPAQLETLMDAEAYEAFLAAQEQ